MRKIARVETAASRRDFFRTSAVGAVAGLALNEAVAAGAHAGEEHTIPIALIGCGSRGTGAAVNALSTAGPTKVVAMADVFGDRMDGSVKILSEQFSSQFDVPAERRFLGMDAYQKALDCLGAGGVAILATPPAFRPIHLECAVAKGCHVFMEKSFAVDGPGIRRVLAAGEEAAKKNLKIAGGLMSRHYAPLEQAVEQIHNGAIGEVLTCWAYRMHGPVGYRPRSEGMSELELQIRNYSNFTWLNGGFLLDWLIHNLDVCCWVRGAWPESVQAQGGRQVREEPDQLFDHMAAEYTFPDGTKLLAQGRHIHQCWDFFGDQIQGTTGCAVLGEGIPNLRIFKGYRPVSDKVCWKYDGPPANGYQREHDLLFEAIRKDLPYNEAERCAQAALTGIMGRMAYESGKMVTRAEALASNLILAPGLDSYTLTSEPPVKPDAAGRYPVAMPGTTVAV